MSWDYYLPEIKIFNDTTSKGAWEAYDEKEEKSESGKQMTISLIKELFRPLARVFISQVNPNNDLTDIHLNYFDIFIKNYLKGRLPDIATIRENFKSRLNSNQLHPEAIKAALYIFDTLKDIVLTSKASIEFNETFYKLEVKLFNICPEEMLAFALTAEIRRILLIQSEKEDK